MTYLKQSKTLIPLGVAITTCRGFLCNRYTICDRYNRSKKLTQRLQLLYGKRALRNSSDRNDRR